MDTKFQTSFIPKRSVVASAEAPIKVNHPLNLVSIVATFIFVIAIIASGALFGYERYISGQIASMDQELSAARSAIQNDLIDQFVRLDTRLTTAKKLLQDHVASSLLFQALQGETVKDVQFTDIQYSSDENSPISITMHGIAANYNALALQSSIFSANKFIKNPNFSNIDLDEKGNVRFSFAATIDPELVAHTNGVAALPSTDSILAPAADASTTDNSQPQ